MLQTAREGSQELDARIECVLLGRLFLGMSISRQYYWRGTGVEAACFEAEPAARWSEDLTASLRLIPSDHNYSLGRRDGVYWAWIQPNDDWSPTDSEYQHDHPLGSGLMVAYTMPLALIAAAMTINLTT